MFILYSLRPGFEVRLRSSGNLQSNIGNVHIFYNKMYGVIDATSFGLKEVSIYLLGHSGSKMWSLQGGIK